MRRISSVRKLIFVVSLWLSATVVVGQTAFNVKADNFNSLKEYYASLSTIDDPGNMVSGVTGIQTNRLMVDFAGADVSLFSFSKNTGGLHFLILHNNENTGKAAALDYINEKGGRLVYLQYGSGRYLNFSDTVNAYNIDPNHIFSFNGICSDINRWSHGLSSEYVFSRLDRLSSEILQAYNPAVLGYIVTLHNNTDGGFTINAYKKDAFFKTCADDVFVNDKMDPDDMVIVTMPYFFDYLKSKNINVVLQSSHAPDDGSLSWFAMQNQIPYANVEVQFGHRQEQLRLIKVVESMITDFFGTQKALVLATHRQQAVSLL